MKGTDLWLSESSEDYFTPRQDWIATVLCRTVEFVKVRVTAGKCRTFLTFLRPINTYHAVPMPMPFPCHAVPLRV